MSSRWVEGIDYSIERSEQGQETIKCLHCGRSLKSRSSTGPHLTACTSRKESAGPTPPKPSEETEVMPDLYDNMVQVLKSFGIKHSEALAGYMKDVGYDDLHALKRVLTLEMIGPQKTQLVLERWSQIIGKPLDPSLIAELQTNSRQYYMPPPNLQTQLTKEDLEKWYESKKREEEIQQLRAEVEQLRTMLTEGNPRKPSEFEEIKKLLLEKERNEVLTRLNKLEGYIMGGITNPYSLLGLTIRETADLIKNSPLRAYILTGQIPRLEKSIEEGARESIFNKLSEKYVSEE
jgi:ribosomal protein L29